jgi:hypothetical protein
MIKKDFIFIFRIYKTLYIDQILSIKAKEIYLNQIVDFFLSKFYFFWYSISSKFHIRWTLNISKWICPNNM